MNSYDVVIFHFMNTHPPIKHIQSVTLSLYIYFGWFMGWVVCGGMGGSGVGYWWVHGVGAYTHPPMNSYNVKIFNFMNTHLPIHQTYPKCHSVTIHILWRVHGVGGWRVHVVVVVGWVVGGFMGWVMVGWMVGEFISG